VSDNRDARYCVSIHGLTAGKYYEIRVAAVNAVGQGKFAHTNISCTPEPPSSTFSYVSVRYVKIDS